MSFSDAIDEIARKTVVCFFLIDVSKSMKDEKIAAVNNTMRDLLPDVKKFSDNNPDAQIKIAIMKISDKPEWITPRPMDFDEFSWSDLCANDCASNFGEAFRMLNCKLDKNEFLEDKVGNLAPFLCLLSDGGPTDDFYGGLDELKKNRWFRHAIKIAIAIGDDADKQVLADFTEYPEFVLEVKTKEQLKKMIKFVYVKSLKRAFGQINHKKLAEDLAEVKMIENEVSFY